MKGKLICDFVLYGHEKGSKKAKLREQTLPEGQRWHLVVLVFVPATPTPTDYPVPADYTVFLAVRTRTMDPTPPAARA